MLNKILIVDDHEIVRQGLTLTIQDFFPFIEVLEASGLGRAVKLIDEHPDIDLALVDIQLPGSDGRSLVPRIKEAIPDCKVIIISGSDDSETVQSVVNSGANGFISKGYDSKQMMEELELYMNGIIDFRNNSPSPTFTEAPKPPSIDPIDSFEFTKRELQIAEFLKQGLSNKEISESVYLSEGTVKNYMSQIFEKMQVTSRTQAVIKLNHGES